MSKEYKKIPVQNKEQEKTNFSHKNGISNSEMIEFLKSQGFLLDQVQSENENV